VPIVIGGHTTRAAQRAARIGNGFFPGSGSIEDLSAAFESMRAECAAIGRDPGEIELTASGGGRTFDEVSARIERLEEMGVTRVMLSPLPGDRLLELAAALQDRFGMDG
jgi:hypothetical protein